MLEVILDDVDEKCFRDSRVAWPPELNFQSIVPARLECQPFQRRTIRIADSGSHRHCLVFPCHGSRSDAKQTSTPGLAGRQFRQTSGKSVRGSDQPA